MVGRIANFIGFGPVLHLFTCSYTVITFTMESKYTHNGALALMNGVSQTVVYMELYHGLPSHVGVGVMLHLCLQWSDAAMPGSLPVPHSQAFYAQALFVTPLPLIFYKSLTGPLRIGVVAEYDKSEWIGIACRLLHAS